MTQKIDMLSRESIDDPYPALEYLRENEPIYWDENLRGWSVTRYKDITDLARDMRFSSDRIRPFVANQRSADPAIVAELGECISLWSVFNDPPMHTRLRALVNKAFVPAMVKQLQPAIEKRVDLCLEKIGDRKEIDFIEDFAYPLPIAVIAEILGVDQDDVGQLKKWSDDLSAFVLVSRTDPDKYERALSGLRGMNKYFSDLIERRRTCPGNTIIDELITSHNDSDTLTREEIIATCVLMLFAGHETTTHFLGNGMRALLLHPEQLADLVANIESKDVVQNAVNEMLRWDGPVLSQGRVAIEDVELHGKKIRAGDRVNLFLCSANRDSDVFPIPDRFDIRRPEAGKNISFGYGIHMCMGIHVARMEGHVAFPKILKAWKRMSLASQSHHFVDTLVTRGMQALPLRINT